MSKFILVREDIGGEFREVAINLAAVQEIRNDGDVLTFVFTDGNSTAAIFDDDLRAALAAHGITFPVNVSVAKAA